MFMVKYSGVIAIFGQVLIWFDTPFLL